MLKRTVLFLFALFLFFFGCTELIGEEAYNVDAIAVWQQQSDTWDVWYSIWDHDAKKWYVPGGAASGPIAVDTGNDHDPDVSSNDAMAIAVWSKHEGTSKNIYFSKWTNYVWSNPKVISTGTKNTDPTIAVMPNGDALSVWVSDSSSLMSSYYSNGQWSTPEAVNAKGFSEVSLPELAFNPVDGIFYLVFTGTDSKGTQSYVIGYSPSKGWSEKLLIGSNALVDNAQPTDERTGIAAAENKNQVSVVWPSQDKLYYALLPNSAKVLVEDGQMPDTSYDNADVAHAVFRKSDDLFHVPKLGSKTANSVSTLPEKDSRPSLTFIRDRSIGLVVWWAESSDPGRIYYSYYESGKWSGPAEIDPSAADVMDRNPAVTPLRLVVSQPYEGEPYCGDGILDWPWEQCEVGIPCPNPNQVCNTDNCLCYYQDEPPPPKNETISCALNTNSEVSQLIAGKVCKDDCSQLGPEYVCDMVSCTCVPEEETEIVLCADNTEEVTETDINNFDPSSMVCKDNCPENYECVASSCTCVKTEKPVVYCADNTAEVVESDVNNFNKNTMVCEDNCDEGYECVTSSCTCVKEPACGDGILDADEDCESDSDCGEGEYCSYYCQCFGSEGYCGDGILNSDEECESDSQCTEAGQYCTENCTCAGEALAYCGDGIVNSDEECEFSSQCDEGQYCSDCLCETQEYCGDGIINNNEECEYDSDCDAGYICFGCSCVEYTQCGDGVISGNEQCESNSDCSEGESCIGCTCLAPPELDCPAICSAAGYSQSLGGGYSTAAACSVAAQEETATCTTTCSYSYFHIESNSAGTSTCCCKEVKIFQCSDCPGQNPQCPDPEVVCPANSP